MKSLRTQIGRLALLIVLPLALAGCGYNTIPTLDNSMQAKWADVQNQYQRRADLIPNLVETVKGYAKQEQTVLIGVTEARAGAMQVKAPDPTDPAAMQKYQSAQNNLTTALIPFQRLQEAYPDLKSNNNFMALQSQLEGTENRISVARRDYNEAVRQYNTSLETFPSLLWAKTLQSGHKRAVPFQAAESAQGAPSVKF
ncbi:MAG TPA: LemA family protein [Caulobacteraceae bacterium]|nr:LemA family protein [Caulobacteraceae bacterium]